MYCALGDEKYTVLARKPGKKRLHGRLMYRWEHTKWMWECGLDMTGPVVGCHEHSNEPLGSIKGGDFLTRW